MKAPLPANEAERLEALRSYNILDTVPEQEYDDITLLASQICETPMALIGLIDEKRQWFKSKVGIDADETRRDLTFCAHAILNPDEILVVPNALEDKRFFDYPSVTGNPNVRFYAGAPLVTSDHQVLGTLCVIDDKPRTLDPRQDSALKALAREVMAQMELRAAKSKLQEKNAELERLSLEKNQFLGMAAHDLRNPLQVVVGYGKLLENNMLGPLTPEQIKIAAIITKNCDFMLRLIDDLLQISTIESGRLQLDLQKMDVGRFLRKCIELNAFLAEPKKIRVVLIEAGDFPVSFDLFRIEQVLNNLIQNAIKFSNPDTTIEVAFSRNSGFAVISVKDQGLGIPENEKDRLFLPFQKTSVQSTAGESSTGLGLAIVKKIIEGHGGKIWVESKTGSGSTFYFSLPLK